MKFFTAFLVCLTGLTVGLKSAHAAAQTNFGVDETINEAAGPSGYGADIGNVDLANALNPSTPFGNTQPLRYTAAVLEGYDSNTLSSHTNPNSSFYTNVSAGVDYQFGTPRLRLDANLGGGVTYYYTRPGKKTDFNATLNLGLTYEVSQRLSLAFTTVTAYLAQPDTTIVGGTNRVNGDYIYSNTSLDANYQISEKFSTVTGYNFYANYYLQSGLNSQLSYTQQTFKESLHFLWKPKTTLVAEYRGQVVLYNGPNQNSFGNFGLLGFDQTFNPRFNWKLRAGVEQRFLNNSVDGSSIYVGPYLESSLNYSIGSSSVLAWTSRYGTEASGVANITQRQTFRTGLALTHSFTPRITGNLGLNYEVDYFNQAGVTPTYYQNVVDIGVGAQFAINRHVSLSAGYNFTSVFSGTNTSVNYNRSVAFAGFNFQF